MSEVSVAGDQKARRYGENRAGRGHDGDFRNTGAPGALQRSECSEWNKNVGKFSTKKIKYSPTNELTHPTETPVCL